MFLGCDLSFSNFIVQECPFCLQLILCLLQTHEEILDSHISIAQMRLCFIKNFRGDSESRGNFYGIATSGYTYLESVGRRQGRPVKLH